jgi:hypothetical protein
VQNQQKLRLSSTRQAKRISLNSTEKDKNINNNLKI